MEFSKNVLTDIYLADNLGDDLFLDYYARSFPEVLFTPFHPGRNYDSFFKNYPNLQRFPYSFPDKIKARLGKNKLTDYRAMAKKYDALLFLGGGIFREESYWKDLYAYRKKSIAAFKAENKPVIFSGASFGPWHSEEFYQNHVELFQMTDRISFRDRESYQLFSDLEQVVYAPDMLWNYDLPAAEKIKNRTGISVIDPRHKEGFEDTYSRYIRVHRQLCDRLLQEGNEVILFSFCEPEGDLAVAREIGQDKPVSIINYNKDISGFLHKIGTCSRFVAARFHAVILALQFGMEVLPVIYGKKTENLLRDLAWPEEFVFLTSIDALGAAGFHRLNPATAAALKEKSKIHLALP